MVFVGRFPTLNHGNAKSIYVLIADPCNTLQVVSGTTASPRYYVATGKFMEDIFQT